MIEVKMEKWDKGTDSEEEEKEKRKGKRWRWRIGQGHRQL